MNTTYNIEKGLVYRTETSEHSTAKFFVGSATKTETIRINPQTVVDVVYKFNLQQGVYVEQSRSAEREEKEEKEPAKLPSDLEIIGAQMVNMELRLLSQGGGKPS